MVPGRIQIRKIVLIVGDDAGLRIHVGKAFRPADFGDKSAHVPVNDGTQTPVVDGVEAPIFHGREILPERPVHKGFETLFRGLAVDREAHLHLVARAARPPRAADDNDLRVL